MTESKEPKKPGLKLVPDLAVDPFDPATFRLDPDDYTVSVVSQVLVNVPVRKPSKTEFFRVHPDETYVATMAVLEHDGEFFLVDPAFRLALRREIKPIVIYVCQSRTGTIFLWPVRLPGENGKNNPWWESAHAIAKMARQQYLRCFPDQGAAGYISLVLEVDLDAPKWPDKSLRDLCELAFKARHIDRMDHPIIKLLLGKI